MRGPKGLTPLGGSLKEYLSRRGLAERVDRATAVEQWAEHVGPQIAAVTRAEAVTADGVLWIRVVSSPWAAELSLMAPRILAKLNREKEGKIRELRFMVGGIK